MKETDEIFEQMATAVESRTGVLLNRGGDMALRLYAVAAELASLWAQVDWLERQSFPQTAIADYLDRHAQTRGLTRGGSVCSTGTIRFEIDETRAVDMAIAVGTVCLNSAGTEFLTTEAGAITAGGTYCTVSAKAREGGAAGNVPAGSICYMSPAPIGIVRCYNPTAFSGGTDEETDDSLRSRILQSYASLPNGSNTAFYEQAALEMDCVAAACVVPCKRGTGTVDIIISGDEGMPPSELITELERKLDESREICVDVAVLAPTAVAVDVSAAIDVTDGFDAAVVVSAVTNEVRKLFNGYMLGADVLRAQLGSVIYNVPGVKNYVITKPVADIDIAYNELPVAGTITVTRR